MDAQDDYGKTALMRTASSNREGTAKLLIESGADMNAKDNGGKTALMIAEEYYVAKVIALLKAAGAQ